jgi:hypothetical protein
LKVAEEAAQVRVVSYPALIFTGIFLMGYSLDLLYNRRDFLPRSKLKRLRRNAGLAEVVVTKHTKDDGLGCQTDSPLPALVGSRTVVSLSLTLVRYKICHLVLHSLFFLVVD